MVRVTVTGRKLKQTERPNHGKGMTDRDFTKVRVGKKGLTESLRHLFKRLRGASWENLSINKQPGGRDPPKEKELLNTFATGEKFKTRLREKKTQGKGRGP